MLLEHGADPGIQTKFGWTPLQWAEHRDQKFAAEVLRDAMKERYTRKTLAVNKALHLLLKSDYSKSDAGLVKDYLKALGFRERNIEFIADADADATKSGIEKAIEAWLPNRIKKDSNIFVYYSGHRAPEPKTGGAYIVPYDGDLNHLEVTGYSLKRLYDKLGLMLL